MTTYEIPDEPDRDELWGPTANGEGWRHYKRIRDASRYQWVVVDDQNQVMAGRYDWVEVIQMGPITDEDPDPPLEILRDRVVDAAREWFAQPAGAWIAGAQAEGALRMAIHNYNEKKGTA